MKLSIRFISALILISLLLLAATTASTTEEGLTGGIGRGSGRGSGRRGSGGWAAGRGGQGRCEYLNPSYEGICLSSKKCNKKCQIDEDAVGGSCKFKGFMRRCYCNRLSCSIGI